MTRGSTTAANHIGQWFTEATLPFADGDISISIKVDRTVYDQKSPYNHIQVFDTPFFGRILVLDGIINIARNTEFIYHEMLATLPCIRHGAPESVLIIGGGDGGAAKNILKLKGVKKVLQIEIDGEVIDVCRKHLPEIANGALEDPRLELTIGDGLDFVRKTGEKFDVIILDITDPVPGGPAEEFISEDFFRDIKKILNDGGVLATHCGALIFQARKASVIVDGLKHTFGDVKLHRALVPEFELTEFGFLTCSDKKSPSKQAVENSFGSLLTVENKYLSKDVYFSSQVLSPYIQVLTGITQSD